MRRLLVLPLLLALTACPKQAPPEGAVRLTVSYEGFLPRCVRVSARDVERTGETRTTELAGKGSATGGSLTVAVFRDAAWGPTLELSAEAFEQDTGGTCTGQPLLRQSQTLTLDSGVEEVTLKLTGQDSDADGFLAAASGGSDCDDSLAEVKPGALELCNARDDDCDRETDEDFQLGQLCDGASVCQGAWACNDSGGRFCEVTPNPWYRDADGDGKGARGTTPRSACTQPAGFVPNSDDCDDGNPQRYFGALELCSDVDEDCDGAPRNGFNVGAACTGASGCPGTLQCTATGGQECNAPAALALYPDADRDNFGQKGSTPQSFCAQPDGGYVSSNTDCDDSSAQVNPGATERCNLLDDDCDDTVDEGFNVGASCTPSGGCTGRTACNVNEGTAFCQVLTSPTPWYPDEDLDQYGKADAGVSACAAPDAAYIAQGNDCNDGDPYTHAGAPELCDVRDNDCNGVADDPGACPANPGWKVSVVGSNTRTWNALSLYGDGGVWAVGTNGGRALKTPDSTTFTAYESNCGGTWYSVWADPVSGQAYLGGTSDALGIQAVGSDSCASKPPTAKENTHGLMGFRDGSGNVSIHGVGARPDYTGGWYFTWDGSASSLSPTSNPRGLSSVHGLSPEVLFAVGGRVDTSPDEPRIYRYNPSNQSWVREANVPTFEQNYLEDVWVVHPRLAYAVGDNGSILRWDGTSWSAMAKPSSLNVTGVVAFGSNSVYVVTTGGAIARYNGATWEYLADFNVILRDIKGSGPDNLWVVGEGGRIIHWPQ